jgi:hypothetical protein
VRRAAVAAVSLLAVLALVGTASAKLVPQQGMAGVALGMSLPQARAVLGAPSRAIHGTNDFGVYTELRYAGRALRLVFQGNGGLTSISTTGRRERTRTGVGVGSTESQVKHGVPGVRCAGTGTARHCFLGTFSAGKRVTDFRLAEGRVSRVVVGFVID